MVKWTFFQRYLEFVNAWFSNTENGIGELYSGPMTSLLSHDAIVEVMPYLVLVYLFLADLIALG